MKYEDYQKLAKEATVDNLPEILQKIMDNVKVDCELIESQGKALENKDIRIRDLQDTNMKLFLNYNTGTAKEEPEDTGPKTFKDFLDNL